MQVVQHPDTAGSVTSTCTAGLCMFTKCYLRCTNYRQLLAISSPPSLIEISEDISLTTEHHQKHIELYDEEYLSVTEASDVFRSLQDLRSYNAQWESRWTFSLSLKNKFLLI